MRSNEILVTLSGSNREALLFGLHANQAAIDRCAAGDSCSQGVSALDDDLRAGLVEIGIMSAEEKTLWDTLDILAWTDEEKQAYVDLLRAA